MRSALPRLPDLPIPVIPSEEVKTSEGEIIGWFLRELVPKGLTPEETARADSRPGRHRRRAPPVRPGAQQQPPANPGPGAAGRRRAGGHARSVQRPRHLCRGQHPRAGIRPGASPADERRLRRAHADGKWAGPTSRCRRSPPPPSFWRACGRAGVGGSVRTLIHVSSRLAPDPRRLRGRIAADRTVAVSTEYTHAVRDIDQQRLRRDTGEAHGAV